MKVFLEDCTGIVHLTSVETGHEYTLCGSAYDSMIYESPMITTKKRTVTCVLCVAEIENCRNVRCSCK